MSDVQFQFTAQETGVHSEILKIKEEFSALNKEAAATKKEMMESFQAGTKSVSQFEAQLKQSLASQAKQSELLNNQASIIANLRKEYDALKTASAAAVGAGNAGLKKGMDDIGKSAEQAAGKTSLLSKGVTSLNKVFELFTGGTILGTALAVASAWAIELYQNITKNSSAFESLLQKLKLYNEVSADANKIAGSQITDLKILYKTATDVNNSYEDRIASVKKLKEEFPETFKNLSDEIILNGKSKAAYDELTVSILATSKARAAKSKLDDIAAQQLDIEFQKQKIRNANASENERARAQSFGGAGGGSETLTVKQQRRANDARAAAGLKVQEDRQKQLQQQEQFLINFAGGEQKLAQVIEDGGKRKSRQEVVKGEEGTAKRLIELQNQTREAQISAMEKGVDQSLEKSRQILKRRLDALSQEEKVIQQAIKKEGAKPENVELNRQSLIEIGNLRKTLVTAQLADEVNIREKAEADAKKKIKKITVEDFKDRSDRILALEKELAAARVAIITDGRDKEVAAENSRFDEVVQKAQNNTQQYLREIDKVRQSNKSAVDKKKELQELANLIKLEDSLIEQEKTTHVAKMMAIDMKYFEQAQKAFEDAQKAVNGVLLTDQAREEQQLQDKYDSVFKAIEASRKKNLALAKNPLAIASVNIVSDTMAADVKEKLEKEKLAIITKYGSKQLAEEEDLALKSLDLLTIQGFNERATIELKEQLKTGIVKKYAEKRLELLLAANDKQKKITLDNFEQLFSQDNIQAAAKEGVDIFDFLGIDITDEKAKADLLKAIQALQDGIIPNGKGKGQRTPGFSINGKLADLIGIGDEDLKNAERAFADLFQGIADARRLAVESEIDLIDKKIQKLDEEITTQEDAASREKELLNQGYANNFDIENKKLQDLKARQAAEVAEKEQAQKKLEDIQKREAALRSVSIAAQSIEQAVNLTTSATKIFNAHSGIPFVGVGLAIAAVAAMFAGFLAIKNSIQSVKARDGRRVASGKSHGEGGNKYVSMDGNDQNILEIEKGEWVINKESSEKYNPLLEAINSKSISRMKGPQLVRMLEPMGIKLQHDLPQKIVQRYDAVHGHNTVVVNNAADQTELKRHSNLLEQLVENTSVQTEYFDGYRIEKRGNNIRKITSK